MNFKDRFFRLGCLIYCVFLYHCSVSSSIDGTAEDDSIEDISYDNTDTVDTHVDCVIAIDNVHAIETLAKFEHNVDPNYPYWIVQSSLNGDLSTIPITYIQLWSDTGTHCSPCGVVAPGEYSLADWPHRYPYAGGNSGLSVMYCESCDSTSTFSSCSTKYMAIDGTLNLLEYSEWPDWVVRAQLSGMYMEEWGVNDPIPGGRAICVDYWEFDEPLQH